MKKTIFTSLIALLIVGFTNAQTLVDFSNPADYELTSTGYGSAAKVSGDTAYVDKDLDGTFDAYITVVLTTPVVVSADHTVLSVKTKLTGAAATGLRLYTKVGYTETVGLAEGWSNNVTVVDGQFQYITWDGVTPGNTIDTVLIHFGGWDNGNAPADLQGMIAVDDISVISKLEVPVATFENVNDYGLDFWGFTTDPSISNGSLVIEKDSDDTFGQQVNIGLHNLVPVIGGSQRLIVNIKSSVTGARLYARASFTDGTEVEGWTNNVIETADEVNSIELDGLSLNSVIDTIRINIGGWDNGNSPTDLQGTYEVTEIYLTEPPVEYVDPRSIITAEKTTGAIDVEDGPVETDWQTATIHTVANSDSAVQEDLNFNGTFRVLYDDDYLYFLIDVNDSDPYQFDDVQGTEWQKDGLQLYFDVRNQLLAGRIESSRQHQISINYGTTPASDGGIGIDGWDGSTVDSIYDDESKVYHVLYGFVPKAGGYYMELAIPFGSMFFDANSDNADSYAEAYALKEETTIDIVGFEMQINDGDDSGRDNVVTFSSHSGDEPGSFQNSGVWAGIQLEGATFINSFQNNASALIYPNPAFDQVIVEMKGITSVEILDLTGRQVQIQLVNTDKVNVNLSSVKSGLYLIKVNGSEGTAVQKLQVK